MALLPFFVAPNLSLKTVAPGYPWEFLKEPSENPYKKMLKAQRRQELNKPNAVWNVYSAIRGAAPNLRVSDENPPHSINGFVVDYDTTNDIETVLKNIQETLPEDKWPTFIETTLGGKIRLVWMFEKPILVHSSEFCRAVLEALSEELQAPTLLAGFDKNSLKPSERWSNGAQWSTLSNEVGPIPPLKWDLLFAIVCKVAKKASFFNRGQIPLNEIEEQINARWPGRWKGEFKLDATGVRFWDETADNPTGCQVKPDGMLCFTGNTGFMPWQTLLGKAWCDQRYTNNLARAADGIYFDDRVYWEEHAGQEWRMTQRQDVMMHLKTERGISDVKEKGETSSDVEKVLTTIHRQNRIVGAAPLINYPPGIVMLNGTRLLNNTCLHPVVPQPGPTGKPELDFPWIWGFLCGFFARPELNPVHYFLTALQARYKALLNHTQHVGQAIFICGPITNGKTVLVEEIIVPLLGGKSADPTEHFLGHTDFNSDLMQAAVLVIDDKDAPKNEMERAHFASKLKNFVVAKSHYYHPKYCNKLSIPWMGSTIVLLNDDVLSVYFLPEVMATNVDKFHFFASQPYAGEFPAERETLRKWIADELPYFAHWLLNVYVPPDFVKARADKRFKNGLVSYYDPEILELSKQQTPGWGLVGLLKRWVKHGPYWTDENVKEWMGRAVDLKADFSEHPSTQEVGREWTVRRLTQSLNHLATHGHGIRFNEDHSQFIITREV